MVEDDTAFANLAGQNKEIKWTEALTNLHNPTF